MSNIVEAALLRHWPTDGRPVPWFITFVTDKVINGTVESLGNGNYVVHRGDTPYYFTADKVIYMYPGR